MTPASRFTAGLIQTNTGPRIADNIPTTMDLIRRARDAGAAFIMTPENTCCIMAGGKARLEQAPIEANHPMLAALRDGAKETGAWVLAGSLAIRLDEPRMANRSFLIDPRGEIVARYDKIHMFDVNLANGESYRESTFIRPGDRAVVATTPWGTLGMSVCYDLRFAYLYRALAQAGAQMLSIPSAFTVPTGSAHWHVLMRARAIETGCFVMAPAQTGTHDGGRRTYGHSLVVAPWGEVLVDAGEAPGFATATIDLARVEEARAMVPALNHDRSFAAPRPAPVAHAAE